MRINFNKSVKMHEACEKGKTRPVLGFIFFKDGYAYASDASVLVKNNLQECSSLAKGQIEELNGKLLSAKSYAEILKYDTITVSDEGIEAVKGNDKAFFYFNNELVYPDVEKVIQEALNKQKTAMSTIGLKPDLIIKLQKSLCSTYCCEFAFTGVNSEVIVQSDEMLSMALLMPTLNFNEND